ncbi:MAG: VOC family protein [Armatimonadota bacterium]|nr:VOC family protein [Armatimonadota bacterium]
MIRLDMIGIVCSDLEASVTFYRNLGLDFADPDGPYVEASTAGGIRVSLNDAKMIKDITGDIESVGHSISMAFLCDGPGHVDRLFEDLMGKGYKSKLEPFDAFWGQRYATVLDPDGHAVDLFAPISPY